MLCVPPPDRTLVFALHVQVVAGTAGGMFLVALLSTKATCEATWRQVRRGYFRVHACLRHHRDVPERDLLCNLAAFFSAAGVPSLDEEGCESAATLLGASRLGVDFFAEDGILIDMLRSDSDM